MRTQTKFLIGVFVCCFAAGGIFFVRSQSVRSQSTNAHSPPPRVVGTSAKVAPASIDTETQVAGKPGPSPSGPAAVYSDIHRPLSSRFAALDEFAQAGDPDAKHLEFQVGLDCAIWGSLSAKNYSKEVWNASMQQALTSAKERCDSVLSLPQYQRMMSDSRDKPRDAFDQDVRDNIRNAFADVGADAAIDKALSSYQTRPDAATAQVIAEAFGEMDITKYDVTFAMSGVSALDPNYKQSIFQTALNLLACDYGVPCGPGSDVVSALCINGGICQPGFDLVQIYEQMLLSGDDLQNMQHVLQALRARARK
jgi:hypothetical protein